MNEKFDLTKSMKGVWRDVITRYSPSTGKIIDIKKTPLKSNDIVTSVSTLMAGLFTGLYQSNYFFFALGTGTQGMSSAVTNLVAEFARKQVTVGFVDKNNNPSDTPTGVISCSVSWNAGDLATGNNTVILTEFGIFGGTNSNTANGGLMVDYVAHSPVTIDAYTSISRQVFFSF